MPHHLDLNLTESEAVSTPKNFIEEFPVSSSQKEFILRSRKTVEEILSGVDPRLLFIVGPCSIHDTTAAKEYATKLRHLSDQMSDQFFFLMRVYLEKPRTNKGWKGFLYDPELDNSSNIQRGLKQSRQLLLDLATLQVPAATEFLDISTTYYLSDLITWGCIGARTASSQFHRQIASMMPMPMAFKNNTDGNISVALDGMQVAQDPHSFLGLNSEGNPTLLRSKGNSHCHLVLRGGSVGPNFDPATTQEAIDQMKKAKLNPHLLIDCSHDNSFRDHKKQPDVFQSVITQASEGNRHIRGVLLESHLLEGKQMHTANPKYGISMTDACIDWETTEKLVHWAYEKCKDECTQQLALR